MAAAPENAGKIENTEKSAAWNTLKTKPADKTLAQDLEKIDEKCKK